MFFLDFTRVKRPYLGSSDRAFNRTNKRVNPKRWGKKTFGFPGVYIYIYANLYIYIYIYI